MPQQANASADDASNAIPNGTAGQYGAEKQPEPLNVKQPGLFSSKRLLGPVEKERGDAALLVHSFVTGLVDAGSFANWGVFVGMQTGELSAFL